jgi:hypothetical protein
MKLVGIVSLALVAFLVLPGGCSSISHQGQPKTNHNSVRNQSGLVRHPYELPKRAKQLTLSLTVHASQGTFAYTLVDPQGTAAWQGRVGAGESLNETRSFEPVPGKWVLTMGMENVTGSYDISWKSE